MQPTTDFKHQVTEAWLPISGLVFDNAIALDTANGVFNVQRSTGVIALFPRYEVLKSPFPEFAFRPGKHLAFAKQWFVEIPVCERLS